MSEADFYADAMREIVAACAKPFGKDARKAKRIATEALRTWGRRVDFIRGGSDGKSRNGEAEAVANAVGRESVAMGESSNTCQETSARPVPKTPTAKAVTPDVVAWDGEGRII